MDTYPYPHHYLSFSSVLFSEENIIQIDSSPDSLTELRSGFLNISKIGYKQNTIYNYATPSVA